MAYTLSFEWLLNYDLRKVGIATPVTLKSGAEVVHFDAHLDTGATYCVFERAHGEALGLDIEAGHYERIGTAMGSFPTFGHSVNLIVGDFNCEATVFFAADEWFNRNVLGRVGFLDRVLLGLHDYAGQLYLSRND